MLEEQLGLTQDVAHEAHLGALHGWKEYIHYEDHESAYSKALTLLGQVAIEVLL